MDYIGEVLGFLDLFSDEITVKELKEVLIGIEPKKAKLVTDYSSLAWAIRT